MARRNGSGYNPAHAPESEGKPLFRLILAVVGAFLPLILAIVELLKTGHALGWW